MATIRVKREGGRGWHNIAASHYDPQSHEMVAERVVAESPRAPEQRQATEPVTVPADWQDMHWKQQVQLAMRIANEPISADPGRTIADKAKEIIARAASDLQPGLI